MNNSAKHSRPCGRNESTRASAGCPAFCTFRDGINSARNNHESHSFARELTTKRRGELAELAFAYRAATKGFHVAKPYGDSERYDFVLSNGHRFWRVQVKCTTTLLNGLYHLNSHRRIDGRAVPYRIAEIDFLAAYVLPEDAWFILPIRAIHGRSSLLFAPRGYRDPRPHFPRHKALRAGWQALQPYREAWSLLSK